MTKYLLISLLYSIITKNVHALECYVTDLNSPESTNLETEEPLRKNCKQYFEDIAPGEFAGDEFRCATVTAEFEEGNVNFQSCLAFEDSCEDLKNLMKSAKSHSDLNFQNMKCEECGSDYCNTGVKSTVVVKGGNSLSGAKKTNMVYYIFVISIFVGMAIMSVAVVVTVAIKRRANRNNPPYCRA